MLIGQCRLPRSQEFLQLLLTAKLTQRLDENLDASPLGLEGKPQGQMLLDLKRRTVGKCKLGHAQVGLGQTGFGQGLSLRRASVAKARVPPLARVPR